MKKSKPVVFRPKSREYAYEVRCVAEQLGLIADEPDYFYWSDTKSKRRFRLIQETGELQVTDDDFDRWANSYLTSVRMPLTDEKFAEAINYLREFPVPPAELRWA